MTYKDTLEGMQKYAVDNGYEESAVKLLFMHSTGLDNSQIYLNIDKKIDEGTKDKFEDLVKIYVEKNIPVQYIMGYDYFYGHKILVNEDVLIPRFETEELVSNVLMEYDNHFFGEKVEVVDVGTGSGCIALALALEESNFTVSATDISEESLKIATQNAKNNNIDITFYQGNMLEPLKGKKYDILVSNPPYIPDTEFVESIVKDNEPHLALFGGNDGLKFYKEILEGAHEVLNKKFIIAFEHAYNTGDAIREIARVNFVNADIKTIKDMQGKDRMTFIIGELDE